MISIEGGDMMVLNKEYLLSLAAAERTTEYAVKSLRMLSFKEMRDQTCRAGQYPQRPQLYAHRHGIHQISRNHLVAYKPIVKTGWDLT